MPAAPPFVDVSRRDSTSPHSPDKRSARTRKKKTPYHSSGAFRSNPPDEGLANGSTHCPIPRRKVAQGFGNPFRCPTRMPVCGCRCAANKRLGPPAPVVPAGFFRSEKLPVARSPRKGAIPPVFDYFATEHPRPDTHLRLPFHWPIQVVGQADGTVTQSGSIASVRPTDALIAIFFVFLCLLLAFGPPRLTVTAGKPRRARALCMAAAVWVPATGAIMGSARSPATLKFAGQRRS